jgi:uncharacterized membrane protein required for colicin V production
MNSAELPLIDLIVLAVLFIAVVRGLWIGMIREGLSLAAIGAATIVTRLAVEPTAAWLTEVTGGEISGRTSLWIAGVLLVVATILAAGTIARLLRRGAVFAGLGWADRVGGGALGAAEGAVISAIVVLLALWLVGKEHPITEHSRSVAVVEQLQTMREDGELPAVASPGSWR